MFRPSIVVLALLLCAAVAFAESSPTLALTNVQVLTMTTNERLPDQVVLVRDGRIEAIGPAGTIEIPEGAERIDGMGGTLIPGLIDLHVHLEYPTDFDLYLANGVTTVLNLNGFSRVLGWREAIREGSLAGPRIRTCGPSLYDIETNDQAAAAVRTQAAEGYDCIKIYGGISRDAFGALVSEASERNLLSIAHIPRNLTWQDVLEAAPDAIAHAEEFLYSPIEEGDVERIVSGLRENDIAVISTLSNYDLIGRQVADLESLFDRGTIEYYPPVERRLWTRPRNRYVRSISESKLPKIRWLLTFQKDLVRDLHQSGGRVLMGTDAGGPPFTVPGFSAIDEVEMLVDAGLTPFEALAASTREAAAFLGLQAEIGTIERGKRADLVLLAANPLTDISNLRLRRGVVANGRWYSRGDLHGRLDRIRKGFEQEARFVRIVEEAGLDAGLDFFRREMDASGVPPVSGDSMNELGYQYLRIDDDPKPAIRVFCANVEAHPTSAAYHASLAEGLEEGGDPAAALASYRVALELNPDDADTRAAVERLSARAPEPESR